MKFNPEALDQSFVDWAAVESDPAFQEADNGKKMQMFDAWADYSVAYTDKRKKEAPETDLPKFESAYQQQAEWIKSTRPELAKQYTIQGMLAEEEDTNTILETLKDIDGLKAKGFSDTDIQAARKQAEDFLMPQMEAFHNNLDGLAGPGPGYTKDQLRQKIWEEPNLGDHLRNIENGLANGFTSVLLGAGQGLATVGAMTGIPGAKEAADTAREYKEMFAEQLPLDPRMNWATNAAVSGVTQVPAQLATAFATPVQITANFGQMFAEDSDRFFEAEKKDEFERRKAAGILPDETPYSAFEKSLSVKETEQMRAMANWKAIPSSLLNTVGETVSEKLALKGIPWTKIPYGKTIQKQIDNLRKANPKMAVGARMFSNTAGSSVAESLTEPAQGITSGLSEAAFYETTDAKDAFKGIEENMVSGAAGGAAMSIAPSATRAFREQSLFEDANSVVDGTAKSIVGLKAQRDAAIEQYGDDSVQAKTLQRAIDTQENEAHYHLSLVGGVFDETRAKLGQTSADAKNSFRTQLAKYIKDNQVGDFTPEKDIAREQQGALTRLRENVTRLRNGFRQNGDSTGGTLEAGLDQYEQREAARIQQEADDKRSKADKALSDFVGSVDEEGPGRAAYARVVVGQMFPNFAFSEEFQDDAVVVETLNAVEQNLITDETDLTEWLKAPASKATPQTEASATAAPKPQGLMTTGQRLDAFRIAEDNLESADEPTKKEFGRLKEDIQFWNGVLNDKEASEQDKAEAAQRLPDLENALLEIATGGVSSQSTNQNEQNQATNQTTLPTQEVSATSAAGEGTGTGIQTIRATNADGTQADYSQEDYAAESRGIVRALESGEMTPEAALQNVEAVRMEIEAAPELTPEQKAQWSAPFQNIPALIEQRRQQTTPTTSAAQATSIVPESTGSSELIAGKGSISTQPAPARMGGVSGDVVRTEAGETVFRNATDGTETVLRVKEGSIDKDPATFTVDDFESGDGTPLVSEADKQFSVLPENERLARPFFRSEAQPKPQDGEAAISGGSYPPVAGSTPAPATPAPDIAAITAEVQANPDQHRSKQGNRKLVSREAAVTILSQLPETLTNKDVATLAKDSGMSSTNFRKLVALRGDQNAVGSLLNGDMDAELGLFDRATQPATTPQQQPKVSNDTNTEPTVVGQSPVDRWVNDSFAAIEQAAAELPQSSINAALFREKLTNDEGRAEIREKLGQMFNTVARNLKIADPIVREEALEKIFRGALQKQTGEGLTSNVLEDLLTNLQKTGDPFLVKSKGGEVGYSAWLKHRNKQNEFMQAQGKRDMTETLVENEGAPTSASQGVQEEEGDGTGPAFTEGDPDIEAGRSEAKSMQREAVQKAYDRIARSLAGQYGLDRDVVKAAVARHFSDKRGVKLDFSELGWATPSKPKVDKAVAALEAAMPDIERALVAELTKAIRSAAAEANRLGLLKSDAVEISGTPTLGQIIELGVIDEIQNPDFYNALNEARESKSTDALMPLLQGVSQNDIASLQTVMGIVLNNGKQITDKKQLTSLNKADMQAVLDSDLLPIRLRQTLQALVDLSGEDGLGLVRNSKNEGFRRLAELYSEQVGNRAPVEVVFNLGLNPSVTGQGLWSTGSNRVHISPFLTREKGLMEATILHEVMHPIWDGKITNYLAGNTAGLNDKELAAITELERLFSFSKAEAQKRLDAITDPDERRIMERNLLGTTNLREFLNEALNHRPFQDFLNELTDPNADGKTSVFRTILNKILELIRGGKVSLDSVLQRAFELSTDIASSNKPLSMEQRTPSQAEYIRDQEIQKGRPLTEEEVSLAAVNYAMQNPRPRFAESQAQADQFAAEYLSDEELDAYNYDRQRDGQPVLSSDMVVSDQQVYEAIKANGGITIDVWTAGQPGTGIVVAPFKETETKIPLNEFKPDDVRAFLRKFRPLLEVSGMHLGGWISDDTVYLDVSIVTEDEVTATLLAQDGNQLAAYNIGTGEFPSTPELVARNSGALAERRSDPDFQNLARSLQQAIGRTLGGLRGESNPDVPREGAFPEFGIIESLTGQPVTRNELGALQESAERVDAGPVPTRAEIRPSRPNAEPNPFVKDGIRGYNSRYGIAPAIEGHYAPVNEQRARDIAAAYEALPVFDKGRETQEAYAKLAEEIQQQWDYAINEMGVTFEEWSQPGQPYANSREMVRDVRDNKHLWFFTGGEPHPLLNQPDQDGLTMNDKLRAIHDLFGHAAEDYQFGARGEENAWIKHSQMFSPLAQKALTTETRGQNSWVNFGSQNYNEDGTKRSIPAAERPFATQKVALLPEQFMDWQSALKEEPLESKAVFPAPDEKFAGYSQIIDYIEKEYGPKAKALKSWINDSVVAYTASYVSNGNHGQHYIQYNPLRMLHYTRGQVDAVMREEMIHAASGFVLMKKGIGYSEFYEDLAKSLSSAQRSKLKAVYRSTNGLRSVGAEYFRAAIQKLLYGTITETEMQETPMKKIVALLKDFVSYFRRKLVDPVVRDVYEDTVRILQKIDKKNAQQDPELAVLNSVSVPYKEAVDKSLRNVIDKAVAEPAQAAFLKPEEFNKAAQSLAVIVNDPVAGKVKARGGRAVNLNSPDDSTARKLEKATGQRWDRRLLDARVIHALTESDRTTPNANKIASAPMVPQTLRQADFVARTDFEGRPFLVFAKLYNDPESPTGVRWHFVEAREDTGAFETQYSDTDPQRGRAMAAKVIGIGDATPKKKKAPTGEVGYAQGRPAIAGSRQGIEPAPSDQSRSEEAGYAQGPSGVSSSNPQGIGPDVSSNQGEVLDNTNVESVQNKILEEITNLTDKQNRLAQSGDSDGAKLVGDQINELTAQFDQLLSAPVAPFQGNVVAGFNPSVYTPASSRNTEALKRVLTDPDYRSVQAVLSDKRYFAWTEKETLAKANEFIDALKGDLQDAYNKSATTYGITPEQTILIRGLALKKAQSAANVARAELANPNTPVARRVNLQFIAQHYSDMAENFAEDLMETASLAGQELRSFRLLADALSPQSWVKTYKRAATRSQRKKFEKDEVLREMMDRIKEARRIAASSTTARMQKALDFAAKRFLPEGASDEEIKAHTDFARVMANQLPVRDAVVQAAVERTVIDGLETIRRSVAPDEQVPESFLRDWENRLRGIASEQINAIIEERLTGGQVDAEAAPELSEQEKEAMRMQKITDAWRQFSDFPISETVFSLAKATLVASDSPYANLVRRAQFDPTRIKKLREAVKLSIDTSNEIQLSVGERRMTVESLKLRLSEANPNLNEAQLAKLSEAVEAVYNEEVSRATRLALDGIIRKHAEKQTAKKIAKDDDFTSRLLPLVNMGAFSDEAAYNAIAERLRLPAWNPDTAAEIEAKARALQELPEDSIQRQEASVQLMSDILKANIKEARGMQNFGPLMQISSALWSAGILSAPPTQIVNASMSTVSVFLESLMEATGYWAKATTSGISQQQARAYFGDMARAWLFAFGKDANNTSLRAVNEAFGALTKGQSKFKSEKLENMSPLEMFKFDPRVAIPGNKMMEAIISGEGKTAIKEAAKMAVGVPMVMAQRVWNRDAKGAVKDYMATMKLVGRFMLAADAMNSYGASVTKEMMIRRHLAQQEGMSPQEIEKVMREAREGGNEAVRDAAMAQVENETERGDFGPAGSKSHEVAKARRLEQLIETQTYGAETVNAGRDFAAMATFNSDPYGVVGWLMDTLFAGPTKVLGIVTKPINPFPKTMSNLINAAINYTPYGSLRAEGWNLGTAIAKSDRYPQQFLREAPERGTPEYYALHARSVAGTAAMGVLYMMIMSAVKDREEGKEPWFEVHGPGPSDPKARKQFRDSGAKPFSLRIGKVVVNYTDWPGFNLALGAFGTLYDQMVFSDVEMELSEWAMQTIRAVALTTLNRAALGGASALFEVLSPSVSDEVAESRLKQLASSYATGFTRPSFIRWAETIATGQRQETRTDAGWLLSMAPVVSVFRGRPALNILGEPLETSKWDATAGRVVTTQGTHPVLTPLTNAQLWINPPESYKIFDPSKPAMVRDITEAEFYDYSKAYGETLSSILTPKQAEYLAEMAKTAPNTAQETLNGFTRMAADIAKAKLAGRGLAKGKEIKGP